ncbi:MAG: HEAT repeat domain-containing protein [Planctomycetes bacterium]|nr:HEAT repeat domain-containing protein [Planctomycetota bacterium]
MAALVDQIHSAKSSPSAQKIEDFLEKSLARSKSIDSSASTNKYAVITEKDFYIFAKNDPTKLIQLISAEILEPNDLTFAAEAAGTIQDKEIAVPVLLRLLEHMSPVVREGAVYGLSNHLSQRVIERLKEVERLDRSPGVKEAVREVLEDVLPS